VNDCPSDAIDIENGSINDSCIHCGHCVAICPESTVFPDEGPISGLQSSPVLPDAFQNLSAGIRTCRSYHKKKVEQETLDLLIENMKHYPSASNSRPVRITVVQTKELIERLNTRTAQKLISTLGIITSPVLWPILRIFAPSLDVRQLRNYKNKFIERETPESSQVCHHAPAVVLFHAPKTKYGMASADAYIWATYASIHANTLGLGSCFNGFIVSAMQRSKSMRKEFGLPDNHQLYAALLIGHPKTKYTNEAGRKRPDANII